MREAFELRHATLIQEFNEYLFEHPEFAQRIPRRTARLSDPSSTYISRPWPHGAPDWSTPSSG